jgi:MFS transporter, YNFM family, putative membrane transport protein
VLAGLLLVTVGFFGAHSLASSWVGRRSSSLPGGDPAVASSLYLLAYYAGSSLGGWVGGLVFERAGWSDTVVYVVALFALALAPLRSRASADVVPAGSMPAGSMSTVEVPTASMPTA